ncbi:restriction endonuclease subunit S [Micromonospora aurantiaca]|uniref:restriction endonuclease subunit S n=1 Tax=Micromonospora aurantiaca (nom. illeg.) TaxID=47850 RepID=UPI0033FB1EBD
MSAWQKTRLSDCCEIISGATPKTGVEEYWDGEIPWATPKDLSVLRGTYIDDTPRKITAAGLNSCAASVLPAGSVLLSSRAPIGHVAINTIPMATNQGFKSLVPDARAVEAKYLYWWLKANRSYLEGLGNGATFKEISKAIVSQVEIPLPPLAEQRRIAEVLDRADELRAKRREALGHLDDLTQSIFLDMFGDPAANPKSWPIAAMSTLFDRPPIYGTMIPGSQLGGGWLCLRVANIQDWELDLSDRKYVDLDGPALERHVVRNGDILLARAIASQEHLGKAVVARPGEDQWAFDSHLMRLSFDARRAEPEYIRAFLKSPGGRSLFLRVTRRSSVQYNINTKEMSALRLPVPPLARQKEFAARMQAVDDLRMAHRTALAELDALFSSLQDRAFRGLL